MAAVLSETLKDRAPRLSLSIDTPPSHSPFPSPSSSFLPPPIPGAHEFAMRPPPHARSGHSNGTQNSGANPSKNGVNLTNESSESSVNGPSQGGTSKSGTNGTSSNSESNTGSPTAVFSPTTPTPPDPGLDAPTTPTTASAPARLSSTSAASVRDSPTSTRPAPPSPAVSRRASAAPSTSSTRSRSSRPSSTTISRQNSTRNPATARLSQLAASPSPPPQKKRRSLLVRIRDFAFGVDDARHKGLGTDVPKPNRPRTMLRHLRSQSSSSSSTSTEGEDEEQDEDEDGWGRFKWGLGRFSWQLGAAASAGAVKEVAGTTKDDGYTPSNTDFALNFGAGDSAAEVEGEDDEYEEEGEEEEGAESPLDPGLYRALFAFEPEGTAEMALAEEQIVRVVGRGGGVGWAVVIDEARGGGHALVPEGYLEVVKLDAEDEDS